MNKVFENILAIDTAMSGCGACVLHGGESFGRATAMPRGQAQHLVPMINDVVAQAGITHADLDAVVTTMGPGAFTGLRIGMSTAKAMAQALGIPVFGVTTLQVLAGDYVAKASPEGGFGVLVETKREDFYIQHFDAAGRAAGEAALRSAHDIWAEAPDQRAVFIGDAVERFKSIVGGAHIQDGFELPDPAVMAQLLLDAPELLVEKPDPVYLRGADIGVSKKTFRTMA